MSDWIDVDASAGWAAGDVRIVDVDGVRVAVFNVNGTFCAVEDLCTHDGGGLAGGRLEGNEVICPRHGARFSVLTGAALTPPAYEPIATFKVRTQDGRVQVRDTRWD